MNKIDIGIDLLNKQGAEYREKIDALRQRVVVLEEALKLAEKAMTAHNKNRQFYKDHGEPYCDFDFAEGFDGGALEIVRYRLAITEGE